MVLLLPHAPPRKCLRRMKRAWNSD